MIHSKIDFRVGFLCNKLVTMADRCVSWCQLIQVICCLISIMIVIYSVFDEDETLYDKKYKVDYGTWKGKYCSLDDPCILSCEEMNETNEHSDYNWCLGKWEH